MLLTNEEIREVPAPVGDWHYEEAFCKAQLKKMLEFLDRKTIELAGGGHRRIIISYEDWQSLLKEIEQEKI